MRWTLIFLVVLVIVLVTPITALAAMNATLSSSHARPGDSVLLLTDDHNGKWRYEGLSAENQQPIYLAPTTGSWADACGGPGSQMVGTLQWRGNAAGLAFMVPRLPPADYWVFMKTHEQCWRVAGALGQLSAPLVLSVGNSPAENQDLATRWTVDSLPIPPKRSVSHPATVPWLALAGGGVLLLLALSTLALHLRRLGTRS